MLLKLNSFKPKSVESINYLLLFFRPSHAENLKMKKTRPQKLRKEEDSLALSAVLAELFDYQTAVNIAKEANASGETIAEVVLRKGMMTEKEAAVKLDPLNMAQPAQLEHGDNES